MRRSILWTLLVGDAVACTGRSTAPARRPGPGDPGPGGFGDDGEWSEPAKGYLLPTFECGAAANTCTVAFEDETLVSDDYGVVDKADTSESRLWECHSDNGTVRRCSLPRGD